MGKIHIVALFLFYMSLFGMGVDVGVEQNHGWTDIKGMEPYEHMSDTLSIFIKLLLNVCSTIITLFIILACMITTCIDLFTKILVASVIYVIQ